ncbi:MAG: Rne/Rng family ribonuclease [Kiritimatiellia bacterium]
MKREIVVNCEGLETRVAVLENGKLEEFEAELSANERLVGSIYKGKIQNLEHDLQAAFVDIGIGRNAFLHYWDMMPNGDSLAELEEGRPRRRSRRRKLSNRDVEKKFPPGSSIVVQVTKGPIGKKGPRVTASLSIPGRYLVLMPGANLKGVSRKIDGANERQRLKKMLNRLQVPKNLGIIARTAASGARKRNVARDLKGLITAWREVQEQEKEGKAPCCLFQQPDLVERIVRDWVTDDVDRIVVDHREKFERIRDIAGRISRSSKSLVHLYEGESPVFEHYGVEKHLEEALRRKVMLKSGGHIVFDETEALVAVDVNTGRHKGSGSQEDAILEVNTEAVLETARQLRLRNVGGLVVIDLIDMRLKKHQNSVYRTLRNALQRDRAKTNILPISPLGILEMTRQRAGESMYSLFYSDCPYCGGRGTVKSPLGMSVEIQRRISTILRRQKSSGKTGALQVVVHPTVLDRLRTKDEQFLVDMEKRFGRRLGFKPDHGKHMEYFSVSDSESEEVLYTSSQ